MTDHVESENCLPQNREPRVEDVCVQINKADSQTNGHSQTHAGPVVTEIPARFSL
jgi:hypothetical protein